MNVIHPKTRASLVGLLLLLLSACGGLEGVGLDATIVNFTANPTTIKAGEGATLAWTVLGGPEDLKITLTPGDVELDVNGNYQVTPEETTVYTLSASGDGKVATKQVTVTVNPRDPIDPTPPTNPDPDNEPDVACGDGADKVPFSDANLQRAVEKALGLPNKGVSCYTITLLENLPAQGTPETQITDLSGLEFAKNLKVLNLGKNAISDLSALGELTSLEQVYLYQNTISDLAPLATLSNLKLLELSYNDISDIAPLLTLPWAAENDYVGLKAQSAKIPQNQLTALEELVSEVVYDKEDVGGGDGEVPTNPGQPDPGQPNPGENDKVVEGDVTINNQAELDALEGVTKITGFLFIRTEAESLNFGSLDSLVAVDKSINISVNDKLTSIAGFPSLIRVGNGTEPELRGTLNISLNPNLVNIEGFDSLKELEQLVIGENKLLKGFSGFAALERGGVALLANDALETVPDFPSLVEAEGFSRGISIEQNSKLKTLPKFERLRSIRVLEIYDNDALTAVTGFDSLDVVKAGIAPKDETAFDISGNDALTEVSGFANVTSLAELSIGRNSVLKTISGFSKVKTIGNGRPSFDIYDNPELTEIAGFEALEVADPGLSLALLPKLTSIPSFDNLNATSFEGILIAETGLTSVVGFNKIVGNGSDNITISANPSLTQISGFNGFANGAVSIEENPSLTQISGLTSLEDGSSTTVSNNSSFDCSTDPQASLPFFPIAASEGNAVNCPTGDAPEQPDPTTDCPDVVNIPDAVFKETLKEQLGTTDDDISCEQLRSLTELEVVNSAEPMGEALIEDITGIEYAVNLTKLRLNAIKGIELDFLYEMPKLEDLDIGYNIPDDLSPLASLSNLKVLAFGWLIFDDRDVSVFENLGALESLNLFYSSLSVVPFKNFPNLTKLKVYSSDIGDYADLSNLSALNYLDLTNSTPDDISALVALSWSGTDDTVILDENNRIPAEQLEALGQKVENIIFQ